MPQLLQGHRQNKYVAVILIIAGYSCSPGFLHMWLFIDAKYLPVVPVWTFVFAGLFCAGGGLVYATKVPERFMVGKFDHFGNSHNIFHMMGIIGSLLALKGSIRMYHER